MDKANDQQGLVILYTGNGKGKTTAALGLALRALGHGYKVLIVQFIKGPWQSGEEKTLGQLSPAVEIIKTGRGFTWQSEDLELDRSAAQEGWRLARQKVMEGRSDLVILDELTYLITYGMVEEAEVIRLIRERPRKMTLVITGRQASPALVSEADLVTEMKEVKHPYKQGMAARQGIEF